MIAKRIPKHGVRPWRSLERFDASTTVAGRGRTFSDGDHVSAAVS
jgi:hypothetical protein